LHHIMNRITIPAYIEWGAKLKFSLGRRGHSVAATGALHVSARTGLGEDRRAKIIAEIKPKKKVAKIKSMEARVKIK
jgi:hypothetical protein